MLESDVEVEFQPSPFFNEQLTAFELWLEHGSDEKKPPEQLPIVLQVSLTHSPPLVATSSLQLHSNCFVCVIFKAVDLSVVCNCAAAAVCASSHVT